MTLLAEGSDRTTNPDFGMTGFLALRTLVLHYVHFQRQNHPDERRDPRAKQPGEGTSWSTGSQARKLLKGNKRISASATGTI